MKCQIWKALKHISNSIETEIMREYFKEKASDLSFRAFETLKDVTISGIFREWSKFQTAHLRFPQLDTSSCVQTEKEISCVSQVSLVFLNGRYQGRPWLLRITRAVVSIEGGLSSRRNRVKCKQSWKTYHQIIKGWRVFE